MTLCVSCVLSLGSGSGGGGGGVSSPLCNAGAGWSLNFQTPGATCSPDPEDDVTGQASNNCSNQCNSEPGVDFNSVGSPLSGVLSSFTSVHPVCVSIKIHDGYAACANAALWVVVSVC